MKTRALTKQEKAEIVTMIEGHNHVFYTFWSFSTVAFVLDETMPTACVYLPTEKKSNLQLFINLAFWESLNETTRLFVIIHECLHAILKHGFRDGTHITKDRRLINIAQDITINEAIIALFGLDRELIQSWENYCWIDTVFKRRLEEGEEILPNQEFEYYLRKMTEGMIEITMQLVDMHPADDGIPKSAEDILDRLAGELRGSAPSNENAPAGTDAGGIFKMLDKRAKAAQFNIEAIIKGLKRRSEGFVAVDQQGFVMPERRFTALPGGLLLPGKVETTKPKRGRLLTAVFMDVSGSCISHVDAFYHTLLAFERERKTIDCIGYAFDTAVRKVNIGESLQMGGGTAFDIIETELLTLPRYPDLVVIITDGKGNAVNPKHPERWVWAMTPGNTRAFVHEKSKVTKVKV